MSNLIKSIDLQLVTVSAQVAFAETRVNLNEQTLKDFDILDHVTEDDYIHSMSECLDTVEVMGYAFNQAEALRKLDYVAFRQAYLDYCDSLALEDNKEYQALLAELEEDRALLEDLKADQSALLDCLCTALNPIEPSYY